jgi:hypothetical protein
MIEKTILMTSAIQKLRPESEFSFVANDYSTIKWDVLEGEAPTIQEVEAAIIEIEKAEEKAKAEAQAKREAALAKLAALGLEPDDLKALGL